MPTFFKKRMTSLVAAKLCSCAKIKATNMPKVFISYRQTCDTEPQRVRAFAERLRSSGISVILDQFLLDAKAGGPREDWAKWSTDQANQTAALQTLAEIARSPPPPSLTASALSRRPAATPCSSPGPPSRSAAATALPSPTPSPTCAVALQFHPSSFIIQPFPWPPRPLTPEEERIVATLSYPTEPIAVTAIAEISGVYEPTTRSGLKLNQLHFFAGRGHDLASAIACAYCLICSSSLRFMSS